MLPVRLGTPEQFATVRAFLQQAGFALPAVCERLQITLPYDFVRLHPGPGDTEPADVLELLIRLFLLGETVSLGALQSLVPQETAAAMAELGLLAPAESSAERAYAPLALCPIGGQYFVSDRWRPPDERPWQLPVDAVYPALTYNTQVFLRNLSQRPCERLLDLCSGTGVAALLAAAGYARQSVAADVAQRCSEAAEFNVRLNGLDNVVVRQGDLYAAVEGESFDRILAHPPFVPVLKPKYVYHDGGRDGEEITRRIIAGLPTALSPGGTFQCHTVATDRKTALEDRVREWLGEAETEFDILLVVWRELAPVNFAAETALKGGGAEEFETWNQLLSEWEVERMLDVSLTIQRHAEARPAITLRRTASQQTSGAEADWLLDWERVATTPEAYQRLLASCPRTSEHLQVAMVHRMQEGELRVAHCKAATAYPFTVEVTLDPWMPLLLASCNGRITGLQLYEAMRGAGHIPADAPPEMFAALLAAFVSRGFIYVEEFAPPALKPAAAAAGG